jgi:hypothetical protein
MLFTASNAGDKLGRAAGLQTFLGIYSSALLANSLFVTYTRVAHLDS